MSNNDNLFNFDDGNFTNDFFHLNQTENVHIFNVKFPKPDAHNQSFWVSSDIVDYPLHTLFATFLWWCDENDPVYKFTKSLYEHQPRHATTRARPEYNKLQKVDENNRYAILENMIQGILATEGYQEIKSYLSNKKITVPPFLMAVVSAYIKIATREMGIKDIKDTVAKKVNYPVMNNRASCFIHRCDHVPKKHERLT